MYDIFPSDRERTVPPYRPSHDMADLLQYAKKIKKVLSKAIIDLKNLPRLTDGGSHIGLVELKKQVDFFIAQLNISDSVRLSGTRSEKNDLLICLTEIASRIEKMEVFLASLKASLKHEKEITKGGQMRELKTDILPHEIWVNIFSRLSYQDKIRMSGVCESLKQGPLADSSISAYSLARQGFYSEHVFKMSDIRSAYRHANEECKVLFFFNSEDKFRRIFRVYLNDIASSVSAIKKI